MPRSNSPAIAVLLLFRDQGRPVVLHDLDSIRIEQSNSLSVDLRNDPTTRKRILDVDRLERAERFREAKFLSVSLEVVDVAREIVGDEVGVRDERWESTEGVLFETRCVEGEGFASVSFFDRIGEDRDHT